MQEYLNADIHLDFETSPNIGNVYILMLVYPKQV